MKTDLSCESNRLVRISKDYRRIAGAAIFAACSLFGGLAQAEQTLLCVLVPHFKDEYWVSVAYGLERRSDELGLSVRFFEAGGYDALQSQLAQLDTCKSLGPGAILIGAVSSDAPALLTAIEAASEDLPVIGLVNELHSDALVTRIGVDWSVMGRTLGRHLAERFPDEGATVAAVLLSGPPSAGWVGPLQRGLEEGLAGSSVTIVATYGADTGIAEQLRLVEQARKDHPEAGLMIGPAPAIEAAMAFGSLGNGGPALAATYVSHSVARGLVGGQVLAAPFDDPILQGRLAIDAAHAVLRAAAVDKEIRTEITVLQEGLGPNDIGLSPADYFPRLD
jgi:protein TorT